MDHKKLQENNNNKAKEPQAVDVEDDDDVVLPGFRFHPTDEELVGFYLRRKIEKKAFSIEIIKEIDIYKYNPWDLPKSITQGEKEWYFFCLRGRKYRNSIRPNRVTGSGFWKATGIDRPIYNVGESSNGSDCLGLKKSLVYYRGSAGKGTKTDWMMHEFRLPANTKNTHTSPSMQEAEIWTICRIFKRNAADRKYQQNLKSLKQQVSDSSSKSSSLCSEVVNDYQYNGNSIVFSHGENLVFNNGGQKYVGQSWNSNAQIATAQSLTISTSNSVLNSSNNMNELFKDGSHSSWDELGRIMDFMVTDPQFSYDCKYF